MTSAVGGGRGPARNRSSNDVLTPRGVRRVQVTVTAVCVAALTPAPLTAFAAHGQDAETKTELSTLRCETTAKVEGRGQTAGSFILEVEKTYRTLPEKTFPELTGAAWRVRDVDVSHAASVAKRWREACETGCAHHWMSGADANVMFFLTSSPGLTPFGVAWSPGVIEGMYPGGDFATWFSTATPRSAERFEYENAEAPKRVESGSCVWEREK